MPLPIDHPLVAPLVPWMGRMSDFMTLIEAEIPETNGLLAMAWLSATGSVRFSLGGDRMPALTAADESFAATFLPKLERLLATGDLKDFIAANRDTYFVQFETRGVAPDALIGKLRKQKHLISTEHFFRRDAADHGVYRALCNLFEYLDTIPTEVDLCLPGRCRANRADGYAPTLTMRGVPPSAQERLEARLRLARAPGALGEFMAEWCPQAAFATTPT